MIWNCTVGKFQKYSCGAPELTHMIESIVKKNKQLCWLHLLLILNYIVKAYLIHTDVLNAWSITSIYNTKQELEVHLILDCYVK